jgi:diguanylate cyclase (GGDEF)-like protein
MALLPTQKPGISGMLAQQKTLMISERFFLFFSKKKLFKQGYITAGLTLCLGTALSVFIFSGVRYTQQQQLKGELNKRADSLVNYLQKSIDSNLEAIYSIGDFYNASTKEVSRPEFLGLASQIQTRYPNIEALMWIPRVTAAQRLNFEKALQTQGYSNFQITELQNPGIFRRAGQRSEYFPATYVEPLGRYNFALGFDFASEAIRRAALEKAQKMDSLVATPRLNLMNNEPGFLAILPIYKNRLASETVLNREQHLEGFVVGGFKLTEFLKGLLTGSDLENFNIAFYEETAENPENFLAVYESSTAKVITKSIPRPALDLNPFICQPLDICTRQLQVGSQEWSIVLMPTANYITSHNLWFSWLSLLGGLIFTSALATYLVRFERHTSRVEQLVQELSQANFEIRSLSRISDALQACLTLEEAYTVIPRLVQKLFPDYSGGIYLINASANLVEAVTTWGSNLSSESVFSPNDCWAIRCGRPHLFENTQSGLACQHYTHPLPEECLCIPMMAHGENIGLLYLSTVESEKLTKAKQELAMTVAEHIAMALANLKLRETLKNQSIRDPLTGLFNRRYLEESLEREILRSERQKQSLSVIMLDIDHFKHFNDTFGHEAGDILLQELGVFLQGSIRGSDIACRYGGEEFTLILPDTSATVAQQRAEQLREGIKHLHVQYRRQSLGVITLSLGVASFPENGQNATLVVRAADTALYQAKAQGRDCVVLATF